MTKFYYPEEGKARYETRKEYFKEYYLANKEAIKNQAKNHYTKKLPYRCPICKIDMVKASKSRHEKTQTHLKKKEEAIKNFKASNSSDFDEFVRNN